MKQSTSQASFLVNLPSSLLETLEKKLKKEKRTKEWLIFTLLASYLDDKLDPENILSIRAIESRLSMLEDRFNELENNKSNDTEYIHWLDVPLSPSEKFAIFKLLSRKEVTASELYNLNRSRYDCIESARECLESLESKGLVVQVETKKGYKAKLSPYAHSCLEDAKNRF